MSAERLRSYRIGAQELRGPALAAGLYVAATPIGNLGDVTLRTLEVLAAADVIACEDTRVTRKLAAHYGISTPLTPYHDHNAEQVRPVLLERIAAGEAVALVSDAGTPTISDPGFKLVREARERSLAVTALPGASAVLAALVSAGLPTDRFAFEGFLPAKEGQRRSRIAELARAPVTIVIYESGPRIGRTLAELAAGLGEREAAVCRELTKLHEEVRRGALGGLAGHYAGEAEVRGEFAIVIAPPGAGPEAGEGEVDELLRGALARVSVKDAVSEVAAVTGRPRRDIYRRALALSGSGDGEAR